MSGILGTNIVVQIGIVVKDIEAASQAYADFFGVEKPKWFWTGTYEQEHTSYKGSPTQARAKLAFLNAGSLSIELIEPDEQPSTWREFLNEKGEGVHHIAFNIKDMEGRIRTLEQNGMALIQRGGECERGWYSYIDATNKLKLIIELLENY